MQYLPNHVDWHFQKILLPKKTFGSFFEGTMKKKEKIIRYALCTGMVFLMCFSAQLLDEKEIIFPEIAALAAGAWLVPKCPWKIKTSVMVPLMALCAFAGAAIVKFIPLMLPIKLFIAFVFALAVITLTKTSFYPIISACVLPVMMGTESLVYPISAAVMTSIVAAVRLLMVKKGISELPETNITQSLSLQIKRAAVYCVTLAAASLKGEFLFLAPPLIVTFVEFSPFDKNKRPISAFVCICAAAFTGLAARLLCAVIPLWICACLAEIIMLAVFMLAKRTFPPAGAIALLALIIPDEKVFFYPAEIIIGCTVLMGLDYLLFNTDS